MTESRIFLKALRKVTVFWRSTFAVAGFSRTRRRKVCYRTRHPDEGEAEIQFNHSAAMKINLPTPILNHRLELAERRAKSGCIHHTWLRVARVLRLKLTLIG